MQPSKNSPKIPTKVPKRKYKLFEGDIRVPISFNPRVSLLYFFTRFLLNVVFLTLLNLWKQLSTERIAKPLEHFVFCCFLSVHFMFQWILFWWTVVCWADHFLYYNNFSREMQWLIKVTCGQKELSLILSAIDSVSGISTLSTSTWIVAVNQIQLTRTQEHTIKINHHNVDTHKHHNTILCFICAKFYT